MMIFTPPKLQSSSRASFFLLVAVAFLSLLHHSPVESARSISSPEIAVIGAVYCDICSNNSFSKHSFFLPGVEVRMDCTFKAIAPRTSEQISFSVNRTTNKYGISKLEVPSVDGVQCAKDKAVGNLCRATLVSTSSYCNIPALRTTTDEISIRSTRDNVCVYSLSALTYRPSKRDDALCGI